MAHRLRRGARVFIEYNGKSPQVHHSAFVAPTAVLIGDVEVGEQASIWFGVVLRGDNGPIRIGARANVQDNSVVHVSENCQTVIGDDVTVGHCATLEDCTIEAGALIGTNAVVLNGAVVGRRSLVAAGSVVGVNAVIPPESVAAGAPAVVKKKLEGPAVAWVDHAGPEYVHLSRSYLREGLGDPAYHKRVAESPIG
jgi:carbonic anhydrase/acetyltransferase-like protein (isoleucine patch superfamily)